MDADLGYARRMQVARCASARRAAIGFLVGIGLCLLASSARVGAEVVSVELAPTCSGPCEPRLVPVGASKVLALWAGDDGSLQTQLLEARMGTRLGASAALGRIAAEDVRVQAVTTPDDDVVLLGALADGRVTFARGSLAAERRVAPRVLLPATGRDVLGVAATPLGSGLAVVVLRGERDVPGGKRGSMDVELYKVGAGGDPLGLPLRWSSSSGFDPRIAHCGDALYLAWCSIPAVVVTVVSSAGEHSSERTLSNDALDELGPLACVGAEGRLLATFSTPPKRISIASLEDSGKALVWRRKPLADPISDVQVGTGRAYLFLDARQAGTTAVQRLDLTSETLAALPVALPPLEPCAVTDAEKTVVCGSTQEVESSVECRRVVNRVLATAHGGSVSSTSEKGAEAAPFFDGASRIADPDAPSATALAARQSRLACGEPGWEPLREALASWCDATERRRSRRLKPFCETADPHSLLYQATNCTDLPLSCGKTARREVLDVDRRRYDAGDDVEVRYMNCSATFKRTDGKWRVDDTDCAGDI